MDWDDFYQVGHVAKLYRVHGHVEIGFNNEIAEQLRSTRFLFVEMVKKPVPFLVESFKIKSPTNAIVKFEDVDDRDEAAALLKKKIFLPEKILQEVEGEEAVFNLLPGYTVKDHKLGTLGEVEEVLHLPQQHLAQIIYQGKERLIPLNDETIESVDEKKKVLHLKLPEGLIE